MGDGSGEAECDVGTVAAAVWGLELQTTHRFSQSPRRSLLGPHKSAGAECGASAQNQATKLFQFFREDDGYNETFAAAKW